jgi:hypothetical protein
MEVLNKSSALRRTLPAKPPPGFPGYDVVIRPRHDGSKRPRFVKIHDGSKRPELFWVWWSP